MAADATGYLLRIPSPPGQGATAAASQAGFRKRVLVQPECIAGADVIVHPRRQGLVVVGAGPAGLAPLFAAARAGLLQQLLDLGVTILERTQEVGSGALGGYHLSSDSTAEALLAVLTGSGEPRLDALWEHATTRAVASFGQGAVPLALAGDFLALAGEAMCAVVEGSRFGHVVRGAQALWVQQTAHGAWRTRYVDAHLRTREIEATNVLLATGATQPLARLEEEPVAGTPLLPRFGGKLLQSGQVFAGDGLEEVQRRLAGKSRPRVVIVGGSTSAAAVAHTLLSRMPEVPFGEDGVTLLHRSPLRIFYETAEAARAEGYADFQPQDVCSITGRVYRFSGFRLQSRELMMRALGIGGRPPEPRLRLQCLRGLNDVDSQHTLAQADLVVAALGYRPRLLPVLDRHMARIKLGSAPATNWSSVDGHCRVLASSGPVLHGLFAMGLAVGPRASARLGGEAGYTGQINSLWMWQHVLGEVVVNEALRRAHVHAEGAHLLQELPAAAVPRLPTAMAGAA